MKFYSETLKKFFDSEEECSKSEKEFEQKKLAEQEAKKKQEELALVSKKELAKKVDDADAKLSMAYKDYDAAVEEVKKLREEYNAKVDAILSPAKKAIKEAQSEKYKAIRGYNEKYGTYTTTYTGDRAYEEFKRASSWISDLFNFNIF